MYQLAAIIQSQPGGAPSALGIVNTLGIAIFIVFIGLLLLMSAHWYRMKDQIDRKHRIQKRGMFGTDEGRISQLQYMSRSELKEMIIKERAQVETETMKRPEPRPVKEGFEKLTPIGSAGAPTYPTEDAHPGPVAQTESGYTAPVDPAEYISPPAPPNEADVLARILMHGEAKADETEASEPKEKKDGKPSHPYSDRIERSISSNDSLEEFRRKSRRI